MLPRRGIEPVASGGVVWESGNCGDRCPSRVHVAMCVENISLQVRHLSCLVQSVCNSTHYFIVCLFVCVVGLG